MLNLLPTLYKKELKNEENFRLILILGILALSFLVSFFLLLLAIRIYIGGQIEAQNIIIETQQRDSEQENPVSRIRGLNKTIADTSSFYENQAMLSGLLRQVTSALPLGVHVTSFHYSPASSIGTDGQKIVGRITLSGVVPTTDDLLVLKKNLETDPMFSSPEIPPSAWKDPSAVNIKFSVNIDVHLVEK